MGCLSVFVVLVSTGERKTQGCHLVPRCNTFRENGTARERAS